MTREELSKLAEELNRLAGEELPTAFAYSWHVLALIIRERDRRPPLPPPDVLRRITPRGLRGNKTVVRRFYVSHIEQLWRRYTSRPPNAVGAYRTTTYDSDERRDQNLEARRPVHAHDGPLMRLLMAFFEEAGEPQKRGTLWADVQFLRKNKKKAAGD